MSDFKTALSITGLNEGQYANNPDDKGGETYRGIARNYWPQWAGWLVVDTTKHAVPGISVHDLNHALNGSPSLQQLVTSFYKQNFWNVNKLDLINDQQIANSVYDFGVNSGVGRAAKYLQRVVGVNQDGVIGNHTIEAVNSTNPETVYNAYNDLRRAFYNRLAVGDQAQFLHSWLSRLVGYKK